jgi:hypothetical protein
LYNEKIKFIISPIKKKIPETSLIFVLVLGRSKFTPIANVKDVEIKRKLPIPKSKLFSYE